MLYSMIPIKDLNCIWKIFFFKFSKPVSPITQEYNIFVLFNPFSIVAAFSIFLNGSTPSAILLTSFFFLILAYRSPFYRFGKKFILIFWIKLAAIPIVFFPILLWILYKRNILSKTVIATGQFLKNFNLLTASAYLFFLATIFSIAAYLNIRKLPQK